MKTAYAAGWIFRIAFIALMAVAATLLVINLSLGEKPVDRPLIDSHAVRDEQFVHTLRMVLRSDFVGGNKIQTLSNGEEIFPAMLKAIREARHTITLETYIFYSGETARQFSDALIERARAGVKVHVLLDWVGGQIKDDMIERMENSNINLRWYHAPHWTTLQKMNNRTHRKILVVDGRIGFTGGTDIADQWRGDAQNPNHWRDTHFRLTGPIVGQLQAAFLDNWLQATGELLHGTQYLPVTEPTAELQAQLFMSAPGGGSESMQLMYLLSIAAARQTLRIGMAYFVPDEVAIAELATAAQRGVKVQIIVPGKYIDWNFVRRASRHRWGLLLKAGVEIYEYQPTMYHVKLLVADDLWTSVGSSNFDNRSFSINDEANLNVYDADFAQTQIETFERDLLESKPVTLQEWQERPWIEKALDFAASLISAQL